MGAVHKAKTALFSKGSIRPDLDHCHLKIAAGRYLLEDMRREGYDTSEEFKEEWISINGRWDPEIEVYMESFKLAGVGAS